MFRAYPALRRRAGRRLVKAGPDFEVLAANKLGEMTLPSPAVANGALFLRTVDHLYCIKQK